MALRFALVVTLVSFLAVPAGVAAADDAPPASGPGQAPPKAPEKKDDAPKDGAKDGGAAKEPEAPAATLEQVLADLADTKFVVKRLDAAAAAKTFQDPRLLPLLTKLLRDESPDVRTAAIQALGARTEADHRKKAADSLADRLKVLDGKPEAQGERIAVAGALHDLAQPGAIGVLLDGIGTGTTLDEVDARCRAVANVPSPKAIEELINLMAKRHRDGSGIRSSATKALQYATGERSGNDPDQWRAWWKDHEKSFDFDAAAERREKENAAKAERADRKEKGRGGKKKE